MVKPRKLSSKKHAFAAALFGLLTVASGVVSTVLFYFFLENFYENTLLNSGPPFAFWWTPLSFIFPGILGVTAAVVRNKLLFAFYLAVALMTLLVTGVFFIVIVIFVLTLPYQNSPKDCTVQNNRCFCQRDIEDVFPKDTSYRDCDQMFEMIVYGHVATGIYVVAWALCFAGSLLSCITCSYIERQRARDIVAYKARHSPSVRVATVQPPGRGAARSGQDNMAYIYT